MTISLLTNTSAIAAQNNLNRNQTAFDKSVARLSSGLRIVSPDTDPGGLSMGTRINASVVSLKVVQTGISEAITEVQTADAGYSDINDLLTRMRELAVEATNVGTITASDTINLNTEYQTLLTEVGRVAAVTQYNGTFLISSSPLAAKYQVGISNTANDSIAFTFSAADAATLKVTGTDVSTSADASTALNSINSAITSVTSFLASDGGVEAQLQSALNYVSGQYVALQNAHSAVMDVDIAQETTNFVNAQILLQSGAAVLTQANQTPQIALKLIDSL